MQEVAIVGAGELGGSLAHVLARRGVTRAIRLIDEMGQVAAGKALDIMQASPIEGFATRVTGSADLSTSAGADAIVIADPAGRGEWLGDEALLVLKRLSQLARQSVVLVAGATSREIVERGVRELGFGVGRLVGTAPEALASALRALIALEVNGSAANVALTVLGVPPANVVIPWEDVTIGGIAATRVLNEPARRRLAGLVGPLWPPGPYALATSAVEAIAGIAGRSRRSLSCFVAPDDTGGRRARAAAFPVRFGSAGVISVDVPKLDANARVALDNATSL